MAFDSTLAAALFAGLFALFTGVVTAALLPLAFGGVAMLLSGRIFTMLPGLLLLAAACAGLSAGLGAALLSLLAAALFGAAQPARVEQARGVRFRRAIGAAHDAIAFAHHHLTQHMGDKSRRQARPVPERVMARRLSLRHKFDLQARRLFGRIAGRIMPFTIRACGRTGFFDGAHRLATGAGACFHRHGDGR